MITIDDLKAFVNDSSFPDAILQNCIDIATNRVLKLLNTDTLPDTPEVRKALLLLAASELATNVNMYWKRAENHQTMNVKNMVAEAERLLNLVPKASVIWQAL
jgi:hypothetical protein